MKRLVLLSFLAGCADDPGDAGGDLTPLGAWAGDAPVVIAVEVVDADPSDAVDGPLTHGMLRITAVLRDDDGTLAEGDLVDFEWPGADFGDHGVLTSAAPVLVPGDEGLLALVVAGDSLWPFAGNRSWLPTVDGRVDACLNPDERAIVDCAEAGRIVLVDDSSDPRDAATTRVTFTPNTL